MVDEGLVIRASLCDDEYASTRPVFFVAMVASPRCSRVVRNTPEHEKGATTSHSRVVASVEIDASSTYESGRVESKKRRREQMMLDLSRCITKNVCTRSVMEG